MSLRNIKVQYIGDTLYLPTLEREVKHIIMREADVADLIRYEPIVRCRDCKHYRFKVEPDGFCAWGERREP